MKDRIQHLQISTPGRICLFGEHQDYLLLPVIPSAISLRISIYGKRRRDNLVCIDLPDIHSHEEFILSKTSNYVLERDYFRSAVNVLHRKGYTFSSGFDCIVKGDIPISAGTSSSSALVVTWINFLAKMSDQEVTLLPEEIGKLAHQAEVVEFNEPGGMMDQYSTATGGTLYIEFDPSLKVQKLNSPLGSFVLGDSNQPKDTKYILSKVKNRVLNIVAEISTTYNEFSLQKIPLDDIEKFTSRLDIEQRELLYGTIRNRDITSEAFQLLQSNTVNKKKFGNLMSEHHSILRDVLKISTPKIDRMLDSAMHAGAYGGKINGSGGGGCMFVYAPENPERVAEAIATIGGKAFIVHVDSGTRYEQMEGKIDES